MTTIGEKTSGKTAWLNEPAASSYERMLADGCPAGGITDAGRTNDEQRDIYNTWLRQLSLPKALRKYKGSAAKPGESKHEKGNALDLAGAPLAWVRLHGKPYGWLCDQVAGEPWHVEYHEEFDQHRPVAHVAAHATPAVTTATLEDDMPLTQGDLEAIDRVIAHRIDERLRQSGTWGVMLSQLGLEAVDRVVAGRIDERLRHGGPVWGAVLSDASIAALTDAVQRAIGR